MAYSPAFQFYPNDYLSDKNTIPLTAEESGAYCLLMFVCWENDGLENDMQELADIARIPVERFAPIWERRLRKCFMVEDKTGRIFHPRLIEEIKKQKAWKKDKSKAGTIGAAKRWESTSNKDSTAIASPSRRIADDSSSSSSSSSSSKKNNTPIDVVREVFENWQTVLDKSRSKLGVQQITLIKSRLKEGFTVEELKLVPLGCKNSEWHMGNHPNNSKRFDSISLLYRNSEKVEYFINLAEGENQNATTNGNGKLPSYEDKQRERAELDKILPRRQPPGKSLSGMREPGSNNSNNGDGN